MSHTQSLLLLLLTLKALAREHISTFFSSIHSFVRYPWEHARLFHFSKAFIPIPARYPLPPLPPQQHLQTSALPQVSVHEK